jgi:hypothetical protein
MKDVIKRSRTMLWRRNIREGIVMLKSLADRSAPSSARERLLQLTSFIEDSLNMLVPCDDSFFEELSPIVDKFLFDARNDGIEVIIKDDDIYRLTNDIDAFVLRYHSDKFITLQELIFRFMREKDIDKPSDVWRPVGLGRRNFHKLLNNYNYREAQAPRMLLLQLSIGLRLDLDETTELMEHQFYRLTRSKSDLLFVFYAMRRKKQREKNFTIASKREADTIRAKLLKLGIEMPEIYE